MCDPERHWPEHRASMLQFFFGLFGPKGRKSLDPWRGLTHDTLACVGPESLVWDPRPNLML